MAAPSVTAVWDEQFRMYDFGPEHPFSERSRALAADLLANLADSCDPAPISWVRSVAPAGRPDLETFHLPEYVEYVEHASGFESPVSLDAGDTPSFAGCYEAAARIVGGANRALEAVWETSRPAFHPAGGLHHARPDRASGFCIFNDVAIAVGRAVREGRRVAYVDIDAHHGDGVMYGYFDSGKVLDIDIHQDGRTLFPGTGFPSEVGQGDGAGLKVNVPLPPLSGDEALLPLFRRLVPPLLRSFRPDLIVLQHGVDGHLGDALANLQFTSVAYEEIDATVLALAKELTGGRLLVTGGGGYRASAVSRILARAGLLLAGLPLPAGDDPLPEVWREEYRRTLGATAPKSWVDAEEPAPTRWRPDDESTLVATLESALGTRFPAVRPA
jgi:acetoin utilization protein AcuC